VLQRTFTIFGISRGFRAAQSDDTADTSPNAKPCFNACPVSHASADGGSDGNASAYLHAGPHSETHAAAYVPAD